MSRVGLRVLSGLQVAALRALVRRYAEEGAPRTAMMVASGERVDHDKPLESIEATSRLGPCDGGMERAVGSIEWLFTGCLME